MNLFRYGVLVAALLSITSHATAEVARIEMRLVQTCKWAKHR